MPFNFDLPDHGEPDLEALERAIRAQCSVFGGVNELSVAYDDARAQILCRLVPANGKSLGRMMECFGGSGINGAIYFSVPLHASRSPTPPDASTQSFRS